jgi:S-formylglutathione hydrolase FrmB
VRELVATGTLHVITKERATRLLTRAALLAHANESAASDYGLITTHGVVKQALNSKGVNAIIVETPGYGLEWDFWRVALSDFAPRLFQTASK